MITGRLIRTVTFVIALEFLVVFWVSGENDSLIVSSIWFVAWVLALHSKALDQERDP